MQTSKIEEALLGVVEMQTLMGKLDAKPSKKDLLAQAKLILEEAQELYQAIEQDEGEEQILKETCDNLVVVFGMVAHLHMAGYNVWDAMQAVNSNNMTKFCNTQSEAAYTKIGFEATDSSQEYTVKQLSYNKWGVFNASGKMMKPLGYQKCSVAKFTPSGKEK